MKIRIIIDILSNKNNLKNYIISFFPEIDKNQLDYVFEKLNYNEDIIIDENFNIRSSILPNIGKELIISVSVLIHVIEIMNVFNKNSVLTCATSTTECEKISDFLKSINKLDDDLFTKDIYLIIYFFIINDNDFRIITGIEYDLLKYKYNVMSIDNFIRKIKLNKII